MPDDTTKQSITPTIVVGLGDRGIENAETIYRKAEEEGVDDQLLEIWINSRSEFPDHDTENIKPFHLKKPKKQHIHQDLQTRPYVNDKLDIRDSSGAKRWRQIARYLVDSPKNLARLEELLRTRITRFLKAFLDKPGDGPDSANIILTAAAGGGTGSGGLPIIAAMIKTITQELTAQGALSSVGFHQFGLVSVATVQNTENSGVVPDVKPRYLSNTALLLSELRAMTGQGQPSFPLEIPLIASDEGAELRRDRYKITENPFDGIYLTRYVENGAEDIDSRRERVNHTAASVAFRWMRQDKEGEAAENVVDDLNHTFYEVRAVTFEAPTDVVSELFENRQRRDKLAAAVSNLETRQDELKTAAKQVMAVQALDSGESLSFDNDVLSVDIDTETIETDGGVAKPARRTRNLSLQTANNITSAGVSEELIEDRIETIQLQLADEFHDRVPTDPLVAVVTSKAIVEQLASTREGHDFPGAVREFVDGNVDKLESFNGAFDQAAPPSVQFSEVVRPFLKNQIETLQEDLRSTTPIIDHGKRSELKNAIADLERQLEQLDRLASEFNRLVETLETAKELLQSKQKQLSGALSQLETEHQRVTEQIQTKRSKKEELSSEIDDLRTQLTNPRMGRTVTLPVVDPDRIDPSVFAESPELSDLIKERVIDRAEAAKHINDAMRTDDGSKPLEDRLMTESGNRPPAKGRPIVIGHSETIQQLWTDASGGDKVTDVASSEFPRDYKRIRQTSDEELTVLVEYGSLHFKNFLHPIGSSEIGSTDSTIVGLDVDLEDSVAYPELLAIESEE